MKILIAGASGLVGTALQKALVGAGHDVLNLVRDLGKVGDKQIYWDPIHGILDVHAIEGVEVVVNLCGAPLDAGRWTEERKREIINSRVKPTRTLVRALCLCQKQPKLLINGSAIGYYGDRSDAICTEETPQGGGFLAEVCRQWEEAVEPAVDKGIRTIFLRTGIVLAKEGGMLSRVLPIFKLGLGGCLGNGLQYMSWIALDDLVSIILFAFHCEDLKGAVNGVAPTPVTNREFTKTLGRILHRPTLFSVPKVVLKAVFGRDITREMLLASTRVESQKLKLLGFMFKFPSIEGALHRCLDAK